VRILLDHCVPRKLGSLISGHVVRTTAQERLTHLSDGDLLDAMAGRFDVLITVDRGIRFQQNLTGRPIVIGLIEAKANTFASLSPYVPTLLQRLSVAHSGDIIVVP
jgi:hypothetical protein